MHAGVDSYFAFVETDGKTTTGLAALLHARGVKRVFACGRRQGGEPPKIFLPDSCRSCYVLNGSAPLPAARKGGA